MFKGPGTDVVRLGGNETVARIIMAEAAIPAGQTWLRRRLGVAGNRLTACLRKAVIRSRVDIMLRRLAHVLIAFIVALAATMPIGARAMTMPAAIAGAAVHQCPSCPDHSRIAPASDKMPACPLVACASAVAVLPALALLPERVALRTTYLPAISIRPAGALRAPDPFPPRSIALV